MTQATILQDFSFRLHGNNVSPETFKAREIGSIIIQLEQAFKYYLEAKEGAQSKDFYLSLVAIEDKSCGLGFISHEKIASFKAAFVAITLSISTGDYSDIPTKTIQAFQEIQKTVKSNKCIGDFDYQGETFASIKPDTKIAIPETGWIRGETIIYGEVTRIGGKDPTATIALDTGGGITCNVSRALAKQLGARLYSTVALKGFASWSATDYTLLDFTIEKVMPYAPAATNKQAFATLSKTLAPYWDSIEDIDEFLLNDATEDNL